MANIEIWNGTAGPISGSTPFHFYDNDSVFQADGPKVAEFCARRLGYPLLEVELQSGSFYACFEEAITTYGNEVFQYKIRENYISMEGASTSVAFNNKLISPGLHNIITVSNTYGTEAEVGGNVTLYTGSINMVTNVQTYDLAQWAISQNITGGIEVRKVFYEAPPAILRYFDPYAGTGTGVQSLLSAFGFGNFSPGVNFLLMPIYFDVQKIQAIEFNDQIRKSGYSFSIQNNQLRIFPVPREDTKLFFQYYKISEKRTPLQDNTPNLITNIAEIPYENITYSDINAVGRDWIRRYTLVTIMDTLGLIRGKYSQIPVPGNPVTLNASDLLSRSATEKEALLTQLRDLLDTVSRKTQLERKALETTNLNTTLNSIPLPIYIG